MNTHMLNRLPALGPPSHAHLRTATLEGLSWMRPDQMVTASAHGNLVYSIRPGEALSRLTRVHTFGSGSAPVTLKNLMDDLQVGKSNIVVDVVMAVLFGIAADCGLAEIAAAAEGAARVINYAIAGAQAIVSNQTQKTSGPALPREGDHLYRHQQIGRSGNSAVWVIQYVLFDPFRGKAKDCLNKGWILDETRVVITLV